MVENDEKGGRPKWTCTDVNNAAVADLVKNDRLIASRMTAESSNIPKTVVLRILKMDLGKKKLCARFVPHSLTPKPAVPILFASRSTFQDRNSSRSTIVALKPKALCAYLAVFT